MEFHLYCPIQVRYGDLDPQGHVNNASYLAYTEQARLNYLVELGLWDGASFLDLGLIVADVHMTYLSPVVLSQAIQVGVCVSRVGNKSIQFEYQIEDEDTGRVMARGQSVMVTYDYRSGTSILVPPEWREKINAYEGFAAG